MQTKFATLAMNAALAGAIAVLAAGCSKTTDSPVGMDNAPANTAPSTTMGSASTMGAKIDDTVVTTGVKSALLKEPDIKSLDIKVETLQGEVMLSGFVDSQAQVDKAISVAKSVDGVKSVQNSLSLKGGSTTVGAKVDDGITTTKVKAALLADDTVKGTDIAVTTQSGVVQLSGFVDSQTQAERAVTVAQGIDGVSKVDNALSVKK